MGLRTCARKPCARSGVGRQNEHVGVHRRIGVDYRIARIAIAPVAVEQNARTAGAEGHVRLRPVVALRGVAVVARAAVVGNAPGDSARQVGDHQLLVEDGAGIGGRAAVAAAAGRGHPIAARAVDVARHAGDDPRRIFPGGRTAEAARRGIAPAATLAHIVTHRSGVEVANNHIAVAAGVARELRAHQQIVAAGVHRGVAVLVGVEIHPAHQLAGRGVQYGALRCRLRFESNRGIPDEKLA